MFYLVSLKSPAKGRYALGFINADDKEDAQKQVVGWLEHIGAKRSELALQVTDFTEVSLHGHTLAIEPIRPLVDIRTLLDLMRPFAPKSQLAAANVRKKEKPLTAVLG